MTAPLPIGPLFDATRRRCRPWSLDDGQVVSGEVLVAEALGVTRRTLARWKREGLAEASADRAACALGLHPALVWGEAWWAG